MGFPSVACLLLSPLNSLIQEQLDRYGPMAYHMKTESTFVHLPTHYTYYVGHPEAFLMKETTLQFQTPKWRAKPVILVVDEAHCVVTWGPEFRPKYQEIYRLRAILPRTLVLALTATATQKMGEEIAAGLHLQNHQTISTSINRPNIFLEVIKRPPSTGGNSVQKSYDYIFDPIISELKHHQQAFPKTVVYTKLKWCGYGHEQAVRAERDGSPSTATGLVAQFHKPCSAEVGF